MRQMIEIVLAGKPMAKERVRITRQGNAYTPQRTLNYEARLAWAAQEVMAGRPPLEGPVALDLSVFMPIAVSKPKKWKAAALTGAIWPTKKPDLDNVMKIAPDSGVHRRAHVMAGCAIVLDAQASGKLNDDRGPPGNYLKVAEDTSLCLTNRNTRDHHSSGDQTIV